MNYAVKNVYGKTTDKRITVSVPGSKSITARALLIASLAEGESTLYGVQFSDDCQTFLNCIKSLGIECETDGTQVKIKGCGGKLPVKKAEINVGSAGTAARFLTAMLAFCEGEFVLDSSEQMKRRPIKPLIDSLKEAGAEFSFLENENCFPFIIKGANRISDNICVDIDKSSQFLSALLISSVLSSRPVKITVNGTHGLNYVNMTLDMMWSFGVAVKERGNIYEVSGKYTAKKYEIEPDMSSASYFYAINKILHTNISVNGIMQRSMQGDKKFIDMLESFDGGKIDMSGFSDQALTLAAIAPYFSAPTEITGVEHIRGQECDRIKAIVVNLTKLGVKCEERKDGVKIYPSKPLPCEVETFGDHRVAMSFALTGLRADGIVIKNAEVCAKTFKQFFSILDEVCESLCD